MPSTRQTNFSGGELDPLLHGRTDLPAFGRGLRACRNFFISKQGAAISRPGTTYVASARLPATGDHRDVILRRFAAADDESFVLEFGYHYVRFITRGALVLDPGTGSPYEVATPYFVEDLPTLRFAQVGEVLVIACPGWDPYELRHISDGPPSWTFTVAVTAPFAPWFVDPGTLDATTAPAMVVPAPIPDTDHPAQEWQWRTTAIVKNDRTGELSETRPRILTKQYDGADFDGTALDLATGNFSVYPDMAITLRRATSATAGPPSFADDTYTVVAYNYYRGRGTVFGYIGQTTGRDFVDVGDAPNYAIQPPVGTSPFGAALDAVRHQARPAAVAHFQQKRVFGGLTGREADVVTSATNDFNNFDQHSPIHVSGESLIFTLASQRREEVRHLLALNKLVAFTNSSVWSIAGSVGSPLDFDSVDCRIEEGVGATDVAPLEVDGSAIYARAKGRGVRALVNQGQDSGFTGVDISEFAHHLFTGKNQGIRDWAYAEDPWGLVWVVREDGALLSLTFSRAREMFAWARHDTDGFVESVCSVPEDDEDVLYLVVARTINGVLKRYIERMTSRVERGGAEFGDGVTLLTQPDDICVDSALEYIGPPASTFTGLAHLEGKEVYVVAEGNPTMGPFTVTGGSISVGDVLPANVISSLGPKLVLHIGMLFTPELELLDIAGSDARLKQKTVVQVGFEVTQTKGVSVGQDFDHLDDQVPREVADGYGTATPQTTLVVTDVQGSWDLSARAVLRQTLPLPVTVVGFTRKIAGGE